MAFKTLVEYNAERYNGQFTLRNDGDYADVIFLYRSVRDAVVVDAHYIKSSEYTGYAQCLGSGCPACAKGIRVQPKLFVLLYNIREGAVQFWDRNIRFEVVMDDRVFNRVANPSEYVFRITRKGAFSDTKTTYDIVAVGKNSNPELSFDSICRKYNITIPDYYNNICKYIPEQEMYSMLNPPMGSAAYQSSYINLAEYNMQPRPVVLPGTDTPNSYIQPAATFINSDQLTTASTSPTVHMNTDANPSTIISTELKDYTPDVSDLTDFIQDDSDDTLPF